MKPAGNYIILIFNYICLIVVSAETENRIDFIGNLKFYVIINYFHDSMILF